MEKKCINYATNKVGFKIKSSVVQDALLQCVVIKKDGLRLSVPELRV